MFRRSAGRQITAPDLRDEGILSEKRLPRRRQNDSTGVLSVAASPTAGSGLGCTHGAAQPARPLFVFVAALPPGIALATIHSSGVFRGRLDCGRCFEHSGDPAAEGRIGDDVAAAGLWGRAHPPNALALAARLVTAPNLANRWSRRCRG